MDGITHYVSLNESKSISEPSKSEVFFELGRSYYCNMDFIKAEEFLLLAKARMEKQISDPASYRLHKIFQMLMRMSAEQCDFAKQDYYQKLYSDFLLSQNSQEFYAKYHYLCGVQQYSRKEFNKALSLFLKSLSIAKKSNNNLDQAYALYGIGSCRLNNEQFDQCAGAIEKSDHLIQTYASKEVDSDLEFSVYLLKGLLFHKQNKFEQAIDIYKRALNLAQINHNWYLYFSTLYNMAYAFRQKGNLTKASSLYKNLKKLISSTQLKRLKELIDKELSIINNNAVDLTINLENRQIFEKFQGKIQLKNCFILLDILVLLARNPGRTYSKEELTQYIWKENYNPLIHDNKIYYNINRLRKFLEPEGSEIKYIITSKDGYYFNKSLKVKILESA